MRKPAAASNRLSGAASGDEARFFAKNITRWAQLSKIIKRVDYRFGEDSDGSPAVWITIVASADLNPSQQKIEELSRASDAIRRGILGSEFRRWPYVQIETE
jgi:hypothetical protein